MPEEGALLRLVAREASRRHVPLYIVGGFVRDLLMGYPATDFDLVVEGNAIALVRNLVEKNGGRVTVHDRFGTAQWFLPKSLNTPQTRFSILDFVSTRSETYRHPAALPTVRLGSLTDDLRRRDFTINTLAIRLDGQYFGKLYDELGGLDDLQHKMVRTLHPLSFIDDPTRLFRLIRYEQRYGFQIAPETLALIPVALPGISMLSADRVRHELDLVLEEENAMAMLHCLADLNILKEVHPALGWNNSTGERFENAELATHEYDAHLSRRLLVWSVWLMDVTRTDLAGINKRLHFESHTRDVLAAASALFADLDSLSGKKPSQCVARLDIIPLTAIRCVFLALPTGPVRQILFNYLETWRHVKPKMNGEDLKAFGLLPGPSYQTILNRLRYAWLDGKVKTVEEEKMLLEKLINYL
jgi:tRNA nucleotidyltransferase (CCA-adding enzyme)